MTDPVNAADVLAKWPRVDEVTAQVGLQCWGCARTLKAKGTNPSRWIEVLCLRPDCPANHIAGVTP